MQRYFSNHKEKEFFHLKEEDIYHIQTVMRMKSGALIEIIYENELYIASYDTNKKVALIKEKIDKQDDFIYVNLLVPLLKEQKIDLIIQKAAELGVKEISFYKAERSIVKIDEAKLENKMKRWNKIAKEASEQSKRFDIPHINGIYEIKNLKYPNELNIICSTKEKQKNIKELLQNYKNYDKINIIMGPEGGLSSCEEHLLETNGFRKVTLGKRIMRVETVPIFLMSIINYEYME